MDYAIGLARNAQLVKWIGPELAGARADAQQRGRSVRRFTEFPYATRTSWSRKRRMVAKAERRLKLLKIGARVTVSVRRIKVAMDSAHPSAAAFARVHARLSG